MARKLHLPKAQLALAATLLAFATTPVAAQAPAGPGRVAQTPGTSAARLPAELESVRFDKRPGSALPLERSFTDHAGRPVRLGELFDDRPVIVAPVYYDCPMLCTLTLSGLATSLRALSLDPGEDFQLVVYSIDPRETPAMAAERRAAFLEQYARPRAGAGIAFLVGDSEAVKALSDSIGFSASFDEESGEWAHAAGIVLATPQGRVARTLYGVEFGGRPLRLSLVEASEGTVGTAIDQALLFCFHYDPATGKYSAITLRLVRIGGAMTVLAMVAAILFWLRRERAELGKQTHGNRSRP